ncbi:MAG: monovalent cation/H(+) antiporter subunit G [Desulfarculus sp.]|jgi:multicomponent Na+:H+ antiporter subunit G|nr:MAG: monovalent cation/H(+) antiporter subunit G [Desulfarculus sp.]
MTVLIVVLLIAGLLFFVGGTVGILRFPDFYTRQHAAGKMDSLGLMLVTLALALGSLHSYSLEEIFTAIKIMLIMLFIFLASPTATHAIVDAGLRAGLRPWTKEQREE